MGLVMERNQPKLTRTLMELEPNGVTSLCRAFFNASAVVTEWALPTPQPPVAPREMVEEQNAQLEPAFSLSRQLEWKKRRIVFLNYILTEN